MNMLPRFQAAGFTADTFPRYSLDGNLHLTAEGHRLAARVILEVLAEQGLLPQRAARRVETLGSRSARKRPV